MAVQRKKPHRTVPGRAGDKGDETMNSERTVNSKRIVVLAIGLILLGNAVAEKESGYFLPLDQKGNLIWNGVVEDMEDQWYNIRIVPGYKPPARYGWKYLKRSGHDLREYVEAEKYRKLADQSGEVLDWSFNECLSDFTVKGSGRAWKKYFGRAEKRVEKRVFGWWLSYPWATMQSCVDNIFRVPTGLVGTAAGTGWSVVVIPAYHMTDSGVKAVWHAGAQGCVVPLSGWTWNTLASPPLSLVGQMPSRERVDGFWVQMIEEGMEPGREPDQRAKSDIAEWGILLRDEFKPYEQQREVIRRKREQELARLRKEMARVRQETGNRNDTVTKAEQQHIKTLLLDGQHCELGRRTYADNWTPNSIKYYRDDLLEQLKKDGLTEEERKAVIRILEEHPPSSKELPPPEKTDPIQESITIIKEVE